jgi:lysophospholipase L1-like esterase
MGRKLRITLLAAALGIMLAEVLVRVADIRVAPRPISTGTTLRPSADPVLGFELGPGTRHVMVYPAEEGRPERRISMSVNEQGFRGALLAPTKEAGVLRIVCLGDSHTFGFGVEEDRTWPERLRRLLAERSPGRFEVLNAGTPAYNTTREVRLLESRLLALEPDVVLLQYFVNDTAGADVEEEREEPRRGDALLTWTSPNRKGWIQSVRQASRLADVCLDGVWRSRLRALFSAGDWAVKDSEDPGWRDVREGLRTAHALAGARGAKLGVLLYPLLMRRGESFVSHASYVQVAEYCASEGIPCFDAEPALLDARLEHPTVSSFDLHASAETHEVFVAAVLRWLDELGWLER